MKADYRGLNARKNFVDLIVDVDLDETFVGSGSIEEVCSATLMTLLSSTITSTSTITKFHMRGKNFVDLIVDVDLDERS